MNSLVVLFITALAEVKACSSWCNAYTCSMSSCSDCDVCSTLTAGLYCASWCNAYTCGMDYCKGCTVCGASQPVGHYELLMLPPAGGVPEGSPHLYGVDFLGALSYLDIAEDLSYTFTVYMAFGSWPNVGALNDTVPVVLPGNGQFKMSGNKLFATSTTVQQNLCHAFYDPHGVRPPITSIDMNLDFDPIENTLTVAVLPIISCADYGPSPTGTTTKGQTEMAPIYESTEWMFQGAKMKFTAGYSWPMMTAGTSIPTSGLYGVDPSFPNFPTP